MMPKRKPKRSKTWAVSALIDLIPFLNAENNLLPLAVEWVQKWAKPPADSGGWMPEIKLNEKDLSRHQGLLADGLKVCYGVKPALSLDELNEAFSIAVNSLDTEVFFRPSFEKKERKPGLPISTWKAKKKDHSPFYGLSALVLSLALGGNIADPESAAPGKDWFGRCKHCGHAFEKKQSNAEYCSKYCMNEVFRTTKHK